MPERVRLDARRPLRLEPAGSVLLVSAGFVDLFAQPRVEDRTDGARTELFRVEGGNIVLGLPLDDIDTTGRRLDILAVGGPACEGLLLDRRQLADIGLVDTWILRLCTALGDGGRTTRHAETGGSIELYRGERLAAPARGVAWLRVERGEIRLMDVAVPWTVEDGLLPIAAGTWIEAADEASITVLGSENLAAADLWRAVDRFHGLAISLLGRRLVGAEESQASRLHQRAALASAQADRLFGDLAGIIRPGAVAVADRDAADRDTADPLFAACGIVGYAMGVVVARPASRRSDRGDFREVAEIARASRLRIRRTLLRGDWWRVNAGPLIAWHGAERRPVALVPVSPRRYVMVEPESGARHPVDEALASTLAAEAATFYRPLPSGSLSVRSLLDWTARRIKGDVTRVLLASMTLAIVALAAPLITAVLVDEVIPRSDLGQLAFCAVALVVAALGAAGFQAVQGVATLRLGGTLDWMLQAAMMDRLLRLPAAFFKHYTVGDLADRVLGIEAIRQVLTGRAMGGLLAGVFCLFSFLLMFCFDARLALVAGALTLVHGGMIVVVAAGRLRHERRHFDLQGKVQGLVLQFLTGIGKLRVAGATIRALSIWARNFSQQKRHFIASQRAAIRLIAFEAAFPTFASLIIFAVALRDAGDSSALDTGEFLAFFVAFGQSLAAVATLGTAIGETLIAVPFFVRLRPILAEPLEVSELREAPGEISGAVDFSQVTFGYIDGTPPILDRLSIQVAQGEYVALVGPSGSGKSTIFRLLLGFEQPRSGAILFDGRAIDTLDIGAVRRQIGVVLQNGKLTSGSIYENICGAVQMPIEQVWEAARHAGLDADIEAMPMGMHTLVTEGTSTLSGGQRQRLMIARALVHRPRMLLFDEATSALDNLTQSIVSASLGRLNVTRIVIAHRLSTVQDADRIIVLEKGMVAQAGTFAELSAMPGPFADLARRQLV